MFCTLVYVSSRNAFSGLNSLLPVLCCFVLHPWRSLVSLVSTITYPHIISNIPFKFVYLLHNLPRQTGLAAAARCLLHSSPAMKRVALAIIPNLHLPIPVHHRLQRPALQLGWLRQELLLSSAMNPHQHPQH
jgi:hypothetical protein